jgi:hypothetical protein
MDENEEVQNEMSDFLDEGIYRTFDEWLANKELLIFPTDTEDGDVMPVEKCTALIQYLIEYSRKVESESESESEFELEVESIPDDMLVVSAPVPAAAEHAGSVARRGGGGVGAGGHEAEPAGGRLMAYGCCLRETLIR